MRQCKCTATEAFPSRMPALPCRPGTWHTHRNQRRRAQGMRGAGAGAGAALAGSLGHRLRLSLVRKLLARHCLQARRKKARVRLAYRHICSGHGRRPGHTTSKRVGDAVGSISMSSSSVLSSTAAAETTNGMGAGLYKGLGQPTCPARLGSLTQGPGLRTHRAFRSTAAGRGHWRGEACRPV
jgi:hypothetical protein